MQDNNIGSKEIMILKEVGNIGAGQSSILLAKLLNKEILLEPADIQIINTNDLYLSIGSPENGMFGMFMAIYDDLVGDSLVIFKNNSLAQILDLAKEKQVGTTKHIKREINKAIIKDIGYRVLVPYIDSLSSMLDLNISYSVPVPIYEMSGNVFNFLGDSKNDKTLLIKTNLKIVDENISDDIIISLRPKNIAKLLDMLKKKAGY